MSKDSFQLLADELTLMRGEIDRLQRTSLNKDEASKLNDIVAKAAEFMAQTTKAAPAEIQAALKADRDQMAYSATQVATQAAQGVMTEIRHDLTNECVRLSEAAQKARKAAWRWDGEILVLLALMLTAGVVFGVMGMAGIQGRGDAREFGKTRVPTAGPQVGGLPNGMTGPAIAGSGSKNRPSENVNGGAKLVHLTLCGTRCWGGAPARVASA